MIDTDLHLSLSAYRYLVVPSVLSAALSRGCTMLHPGYGFLAENAAFVEMCREHKINFIGPNVSTSDQDYYLCRLWYDLPFLLSTLNDECSNQEFSCVCV